MNGSVFMVVCSPQSKLSVTMHSHLRSTSQTKPVHDQDMMTKFGLTSFRFWLCTVAAEVCATYRAVWYEWG
jgi:hypothetical protein